jgi:hypothetical protein
MIYDHGYFLVGEFAVEFMSMNGVRGLLLIIVDVALHEQIMA